MKPEGEERPTKKNPKGPKDLNLNNLRWNRREGATQYKKEPRRGSISLHYYLFSRNYPVVINQPEVVNPALPARNIKLKWCLGANDLFFHHFLPGKITRRSHEPACRRQGNFVKLIKPWFPTASHKVQTPSGEVQVTFGEVQVAFGEVQPLFGDWSLSYGSQDYPDIGWLTQRFTEKTLRSTE